jgi:hypothetical protein
LAGYLLLHGYDHEHLNQKQVLVIDCIITSGWYGGATAGSGNDQSGRKGHMLWTMAVVLVSLWLLGLVGGYATDNFIHIPLFIAIIVMLIQSGDDCSDYDGSGHTRNRYLKRQLVRSSRRILPNLSMQSGEKVSQPIVSPQTYRGE